MKEARSAHGSNRAKEQHGMDDGEACKQEHRHGVDSQPDGDVVRPDVTVR